MSLAPASLTPRFHTTYRSAFGSLAQSGQCLPTGSGRQ